MTYKYFYIDDDPLETTMETARGLSIKKDFIEVIPFQHQTWEKEISFIKEKAYEFDGVILDWKLSKKNEDAEEANYNVEALIQQIRLLVSEETIKKDFPIVLCSAEFNFKQIFNKESTTQDLFDMIYEKDEFEDKKEEVISQLHALAKGYQILSKEKTIDSILGKVENLDYRLKDHFDKLNKEGFPDYDIARFVLKKIIELPGLLIDERLLASRLGINIIDFPKDKDWLKLTEHLDGFKYHGIFSGGWNRWWANNLIIWWRQNFSNEIGSLTAKERTEILNKNFGLSLKTAEKTEKSQNMDFWVVCKKTGTPISLKDSILSSETYDKTPWQDDEYYSIDSALEVSIDKIHPLDRDKVEKMKIRYTKERK